MAIVMMFFITIKRKGFLLTLGLAGFLILSYTLYRRVFKITLVGDHNRLMKEPGDFLGALERNEDFCLRFMGNRICQTETAAQCRTRVQRWKKEQEVKEILTKLDQLMPSVTFTDIMTTTSARNSKATILNQKGSYCVGDPLMVRLDLYNYLGERKKYGGDFLRVRIYSSSLGAGASGHITDYRNGTYLVNFTLFWEGDVKVSILLIHPSEGVSALWAARKRGYDKIDFRGKFLNGTSLVYTKCGFVIETNAELCEYLDERDQEAFYCVKPKNVPCEAFVLLTSDNNPITYLTSLEQSLFRRDNIGIEIPQSFGEIRVLSCNRSATMMARDKCRVGMSLPVPSGYALQEVWHPHFCSVSDFSTLDRIQECLKKKKIYLMGDSTLRQWIYYLTEKVATLKFFDRDSDELFKTHVALDLERSTFIQWKRHGNPFVSRKLFSVKDGNYITNEIDRLAGDKDTVIAITLGQHFRPFPMDLFVRRLLNIRRAIHHLLLRSPETRVIIRTENTREMDTDMERLGDVNGYPQNLAVMDIFLGLNVGFIDAWDMNIAYAIYDVHPPDHVIWNQIIMFLTYIC
ncbi:NXPE family member 1 isoform X1 [Zootoca vivipara]|uniref:NXPE family member 1 isoform X1 n=2 Tax=Zootoca vivipara TaxID=8524 RepID=UPI0015901055|nr:NXPE family member 1 isoform X1 [Zootoca vivipara]